MALSLTNSQISVAVSLVAASLSIGYVLGVRAVELRRTPASASEPPKSATKEETKEDDVDAESEEEDVADGDLSAVKPNLFGECKLVLVVRTDLKMTTGKIAAQCGHATLACYKSLMKANPELLRHWERMGQAKVALKVSSEDEMLELEGIAKSLNLCARSIQDAGRTQIAAGSRTVLGIGPGPVELINRVTGKLRLL